MKDHTSFFFHTVDALVRKDFLSTLRGWGLYLVAFASLSASSFFLNNYLGSIKEKNIVIASDPFNFPFFISAHVVAFYLAFVSAISISREREQGMLEVLFYGPVNCSSYLVAKYITNMLVYTVLLCFFFAYFEAASTLTNLTFSWALVKGVLLSILLVSCVISFSLFISCLTSRMRNSIILLIGILLGFLAIQVSHGMLLRIGDEAASASLLHLREALGVISQGVAWVSPFSYLTKGMLSLDIDSGLHKIPFSVIYSLVFLVLSVLILKWKGVRA